MQLVVRNGRGHVSISQPIAFSAFELTWIIGANVSQENSSTNRTSWPLDGGSVVLSSSHETVITYINLGLGDEVTGFNVSLLAAYNMVGNGTVCLPNVGAEALAALNLTDGQTASIQVVHIGDSGNALYNVSKDHSCSVDQIANMCITVRRYRLQHQRSHPDWRCVP